MISIGCVINLIFLFLNMENLPSITCIMPTCGRTTCIGESIFSFINQTYTNIKLIILDTHPQDIRFNIAMPDNIIYIKEDSKKFTSLGDKYRNLLDMVNTDFFCIWEDDDIWLSSHLEKLVNTYKSLSLDSSKRYKIGNIKHFTTYGGVEKPISKLILESNCCWQRYIYQNKMLNTVDLTDPCDVSLLNSFNTAWQSGSPTYVYRWDNGQGHMSGLYGLSHTHSELYRIFEDKSCNIDISNVTVDVSWRHDYETLCKGVFAE